MKKSLTALAAIALVLVISAGATAASRVWVTSANVKNNSLTGADIRNNSLTGADVKNNSLTGADVKNGSVTLNKLAAGTQAMIKQAGTPVPGPAGAPGLSALDTLPSGKTEYGVIGFGTYADAGNRHYSIDSQLQLPATAALGDNDVYVNINGSQPESTQTLFAPTTQDTLTGCSGSPANPVAPAGKVCVYVTHADNAAGISGEGIGTKYGFRLAWDSQLAGRSYVDAVWAYTAP